MRQNIYIRKLIALTLLFAFVFSITPTRVLHFFFANHKDAHVNTKASKTPVLSVQVFNCACDNIVVESPFTLQCQTVITAVPKLVLIVNPAPESSFHCIYHFYFELRGPPSLA